MDLNSPHAHYVYRNDIFLSSIIQFLKRKKVKVKCTLVQALRLCTGCTAHRGTTGGWKVSVTSRPLFTQGKEPVRIVQEAGWAQERSGQVRKISSPQGFDPRTVQPVDSRYTDYANRTTFKLWILIKNYIWFLTIIRFRHVIILCVGARGGAVGWGTALQAGRSAGSFTDGVTGIFHGHDPSGRTMILRFTPLLIEMSTRNISWG